jgi:hypothetical protein
MFGRAKLRIEIEKLHDAIKVLEWKNKQLTRENERLQGIHRCDEMAHGAKAIYFTDGNGWRLNYGILVFEDGSNFIVYRCPYCGEKIAP